MNAPTASQVAPELLIRRNFDAPRALVFKVWTDSEHLKRWCCPKGFTISFSEGDIRPGGTYRTCMRSPEGEDYWLDGRYLEIVQDEKIVFTHIWRDAADDANHETIVTVTLADADAGGTRLTLHQAFFVSEESRDGHRSGWMGTLDNLEGYLAK